MVPVTYLHLCICIRVSLYPWNEPFSSSSALGWKKRIRHLFRWSSSSIPEFWKKRFAPSPFITSYWLIFHDPWQLGLVSLHGDFLSFPAPFFLFNPFPQIGRNFFNIVHRTLKLLSWRPRFRFRDLQVSNDFISFQWHVSPARHWQLTMMMRYHGLSTTLPCDWCYSVANSKMFNKFWA